MADIGTAVKVGEPAPESGVYMHSTCANTLCLKKGQLVPPCENNFCPKRHAHWTLARIFE